MHLEIVVVMKVSVNAPCKVFSDNANRRVTQRFGNAVYSVRGVIGSDEAGTAALV
jgi:hypothetical protein